MISLFILGIILRLFMVLSQKSFWFDEWASIETSSLPFKEMLIFHLHDSHPPLYYSLLHFLIRCFGIQEGILRLPSLVAGVLALFGIYWLAREVFGRRRALLSLALAAVSPYLIYMSHEIRNHGWPIAFCAFGSTFFMRWNRSKHPKWYYAFVAASFLAVYSSYFSWFWLLPHILFSKNFFKKRFIFISLLAPSAFLFLYHGSKHEMLLRFFSFHSWATKVLQDTTSLFWNLCCGSAFFMHPAYFHKWLALLAFYAHTSKLFWLSVPAFLTSIFLLVRGAVWAIRNSRIFSRVSLVPFLAMFIVSLSNPNRLDARYFGFLSPFYFLLLAAGVFSLKRRVLKMIFFSVIILNSFLSDVVIIRLNTSPMWREDHAGMTKFVFQNAGPRDAILGLSPLGRYYVDKFHLRTQGTLLESLEDVDNVKQNNFEKIWVLEGAFSGSEEWISLNRIMKAVHYEPSGKEISFGADESFALVNVFKKSASN